MGGGGYNADNGLRIQDITQCTYYVYKNCDRVIISQYPNKDLIFLSAID